MDGHMAGRRDNTKISLFLAALSPAGCADWPLSRVERHVASVHEADRIVVCVARDQISRLERIFLALQQGWTAPSPCCPRLFLATLALCSTGLRSGALRLY